MEGGAAPRWPEGDGAKVFAYLRGNHPQPVRLLQAMADEQCRVLCYYPEIAGGKPPPLEHPAIHYSAEPINLDQAFAECAMCVGYGGDATVSQALLAGVPMLLAPMHVEQFLRARAVERMGAGVNLATLRQPLDYGAVVRQVLYGPSYHAAAKAFAARYAGFSHAGQGERMADALETLLP
jgi:UDP:flavonoid glycosyltransferase YjiC (YdhE family)